MALVLAALITGIFSLLLFVLQSRRDRNRRDGAWQGQVDEISAIYERQLETQEAREARKDALIEDLLRNRRHDRN